MFAWIYCKVRANLLLVLLTVTAFQDHFLYFGHSLDHVRNMHRFRFNTLDVPFRQGLEHSAYEANTVLDPHVGHHQVKAPLSEGVSRSLCCSNVVDIHALYFTLTFWKSDPG